jgi:hypothetical protein
MIFSQTSPLCIAAAKWNRSIAAFATGIGINRLTFFCRDPD